MPRCCPQADDREIQDEGLDSLTEDELRQACRARGMRAPFGEGAAAFMRQQLGEWLDWSLNRLLALAAALAGEGGKGWSMRRVDLCWVWHEWGRRVVL